MDNDELILMYKNTLDAVAYLRRLQKAAAGRGGAKAVDPVELKRIELAVDMRLTELGL